MGVPLFVQNYKSQIQNSGGSEKRRKNDTDRKNVSPEILDLEMEPGIYNQDIKIISVKVRLLKVPDHFLKQDYQFEFSLTGCFKYILQFSRFQVIRIA